MARFLQKREVIMNDTLTDKIEALEKQEIIEALKECGWVQARAARKLGITERMIGYKIKKYRIKIKEVPYGAKSISSGEEHNKFISKDTK